MKKIFKLAIATTLLLGSLAAQSQCNVSAWDAATGAAAGGPSDANNQARYSGLCSMDGTNGAVLNNGTGPAGDGNNAAVSGPIGESGMIARFYFLAQGSGTATIFEAYSDELGATPVYSVTYNGTNVTVTPVSGGSAVSIPVISTVNWHSVEVKWASGDGTNGGAIEVWVDSDALTASADGATTSASAAASINAVKLGGIVNSGFTKLIFDDYESRRSTAVGRLLAGDSNSDGTIDLGDVITILNEFLNISTATGVPDTNEDGAIDLGDVIGALNIFLGI